jgi:MoxR-like ATPase
MMSEREKSIADELMEMLGETLPEPALDLPEEVAPPEPVKLAGTGWVEREDGKEMCTVPFSELFGFEPTHVPNHLVPVFRGYECELPIVGFVLPRKDIEWISFAFAHGIKPLSVGPTGCGKTRIYEYYASMTGRPVLRIDNTAELDKAQVFGTVHITDGDTNFVPGDLPLSANAPTVVILDELSRAPGGANMIYKRVLDRNEIYLPEMKEAGTKAITPDIYWVVCATDNTKGDGENMDKYPMSNVQDAAFRNAWGILLEADYLSRYEEQELIAALVGISMAPLEVKQLATFSSLIHAGFKKGELNTAFSPRQLNDICKMVVHGVTTKQAIEMCYTNFCSSAELPDVTECLRAAFGSK